jgi:hypothetical protein
MQLRKTDRLTSDQYEALLSSGIRWNNSQPADGNVIVLDLECDACLTLLTNLTRAEATDKKNPTFLFRSRKDNLAQTSVVLGATLNGSRQITFPEAMRLLLQNRTILSLPSEHATPLLRSVFPNSADQEMAAEMILEQQNLAVGAIALPGTPYFINANRIAHL